MNRNFSVSSKTLQTAQNGIKLSASGLATATQIHESAVALIAKIPVSRQQFLRSHLVVQSAIQRYAVSAIQNLANATLILAADSVPTSESVSAANADVNAALSDMDKLFAAERDAVRLLTYCPYTQVF